MKTLVQLAAFVVFAAWLDAIERAQRQPLTIHEQIRLQQLYCQQASRLGCVPTHLGPSGLLGSPPQVGGLFAQQRSPSQAMELRRIDRELSRLFDPHRYQVEMQAERQIPPAAAPR